MVDSQSSILARLREFEHSGDRLIRLWIALLVPSFAGIGVVAALSNEGPRSPLRLAISVAVLASTIPVGAAMTRFAPRRSWWGTPDARRRPGAWFVLYADLGVAAVLFTFVDAELAMYGTALFAVIGSYASHFVDAVAVGAHVCFTSVVIIVLGVLTLRQGGHDAASVIARGLTSILVSSAAVILVYVFTSGVRRTLGAQIDEAARDSLTGLWNRRGFTTLAKGMLASHRDVSIIVIDIDDFKRVNDQHGHAAGDVVLKRLAERVQRVSGAATVVARTGGEEFTLASPEDGDAMSLLAERIRTSVHDVADEISVSVSIGVCRSASDLHTGGRIEPIDLLLDAMRAADFAMYQAKSAGGNRIVAPPSPRADPER